MSLEEIKNVYKNKKKIKLDFFEKKNRFSADELIGFDYDLAAENVLKNSDIHLSDSVRDDIKTYYFNQIGEANLSNAKDYDMDLVNVDSDGDISDLNFPTSFFKAFITYLVYDFVTFFIIGLVSQIGGGTGLISLILALLAWAVPLLLTWEAYSKYKHEENQFKKSSVKSEDEKQSISKVKYAPLLAFLILIIVNVCSLFFIII